MVLDQTYDQTMHLKHATLTTYQPSYEIPKNQQLTKV
jgi:hypothetical protein